MMLQFLLIFFVFYCSLGCDATEQPFVKFPQGTVQGHYKRSYGGRTFSAFEGIPYAKPPVNDLRFAEPQPHGKLKGTLIANRTYSCLCYTPIGVAGVFGSEDCLYLYVYVPLNAIKGDENLNVIVHIHGGAFMFGAPDFMAGPEYLMDKDVVFVTFNYRVAILGFLSTEDNVVSGNNGLKDQVMALKWIHDNIKYFGGNPNSVTITGLSAGAACVHYHYLSPLSKGLFHRGMSQSGSALDSWALIENPLKKAQQVAGHLDCPIDSTKNMIDCLKKINDRALITAMTKLFIYRNSIPFIVFGPVIEKGQNPFLQEHPYKLMKEGNINDVPWVTSNVKDEGIFPASLFLIDHAMEAFDKQWDDFMYYILDLYDTVDESNKLNVVKAIRKFYYGDEAVSDKNVYKMVKLFSDRYYLTSSEKAIRLQSQVNKSPVYYYFFTYLMANSLIPEKGMKRGVAHSDDAGLYLKLITSPRTLPPSDEKMMKLFTEFVVGYANSSKPSINGVEWLPLEPGNKLIHTLKFESPDVVEMIEMEHVGSIEFWNNLPINENEKLFPELA